MKLLRAGREPRRAGRLRGYWNAGLAGREPRRAGRLRGYWNAGLAAGLLLAAVPGARAQSLPVEEKAQFEKQLERRAEEVLLRLYGPGRHKVVVDATLDFTRIEKFEVKGGAAKDQNSVYLWQNVGADAVGRSELLPGFPVPEPVPGFGQDKSYTRQNSIPEDFIKRLSVTLILDRKLAETLTEEQTRNLERLMGDVLELFPNRDTFRISRADFAPLWKTIWYQPESMSMLLKYGMISLMTLITLIVVAACFLKLAEAMDSMAQAQGNQFQMDIGDGENKEGEEGDKEGEEAKKELEAEPPNKIYFEVKPEQVETLWEILQRQAPDNIALVVAHLRPETKERFLDRLPPNIYGEVIIHLGQIRFIEADVIQTIKEELERRLESAVGGRRQLFQMLDKADMKTKRELLRMLETRDPETALLVRAKVILFEDLAFLDDREWSLVLGRVRLEDWGAALQRADEAMKDAVRTHMLPRTWAIIEQIMTASRTTEAAGDQAQEKVVGEVEKLVEEGKIENPAGRRPALAPPPAELAPPAFEEAAVPAGAPGEAPPAFEPPQE